ncbi:hypothetical protein JY96_21165 [Aquabacterium sp. NJ1]|uniref:hypothetical protein n=1 Tax=Aquabacterium sp. NJ1 TaxID=1538295 RepID=UPI00052C5420|nr:hypothetical protein [Aquabacterium sp. NJ1]KGM38690.1 hypothetical protein JY96_21165 [Aquabacterium sp. NJ1]
MKLYLIREQADVFVDAAVADDHGQLLFVSLFGRDTAIQQFMSRLHLRGKEGGVDRLRFSNPETFDVELEVLVGDPNRLDKVTGRLPKENLFGNLVHAWIFDSSVVEVDKAGRSGWYVQTDLEASRLGHGDAIWRLVTALSPVPLLDHWREPVISMLGQAGVRVTRSVGDVCATRVALPDDFEAQISNLVVDGTLTESPESRFRTRSLFA